MSWCIVWPGLQNRKIPQAVAARGYHQSQAPLSQPRMLHNYGFGIPPTRGARAFGADSCHLQEQKKKKVKGQKYSFEVKGEIECWRWIESLNGAIANVMKSKNESPNPRDNKLLSPNSGSGNLTRSRSTSAPPAIEPLQRNLPGNRQDSSRRPAPVSDDSEDDEVDPYADPYDSHTDDDESFVPKEKEAEPHERRSTIHSVPSSKGTPYTSAKKKSGH